MNLSTHVSVLLQEAIEHLNLREGHTYVDMTLGGGGHSQAILDQLQGGHLFCFDQDDYALAYAKERLSNYSNVTFIKSNFRFLKEELQARGISGVDGILFDLGVSSFQFDIPERGFSYQHDSPLDMRMDPDSSLTAKEIVNTWDEQTLSKTFWTYGEEDFSRPIAKAIVTRRQSHPIETTFELVEVIKSALPNKILSKKGHPAKQVFQALRIAVNDELVAFEEALEEAIEMLNPGGRIVVITFHSLEDRICKQTFRRYSTIDLPKGLPVIITEKPLLALVNKHVITPSEAEISANNRAHSAKMRVVEKTR